jgi:hypothetical protein
LANEDDDGGRRKKRNKYADFSSTDNLSMDPLDAILHESRTKLREMYGREGANGRSSSSSSSSSNVRRGRQRKLSSIESSSLDAVERLLSDYRDMGDGVGDGEEEEETRERNKRIFPDTTTIDPYDPTTYGYIELGEHNGVDVIFSFILHRPRRRSTVISIFFISQYTR